MGIRDRLKALTLPPGATTVTEQQAAAIAPQSGARAEPLERDPRSAITPFPAGMPLIPALINERRSDGRADPRRSEFPVAWNLQISEQRSVPFKVLREVADQADIVRKCIEVVKAAISGMAWDISIAEDAIARTMSEQTVGSTEAAKLVRERYQKDITRAKDFWKSPDRANGMTFQEWVGMMLEEVLVIDALSIYPNRSINNRQLHSLEILDGATIKPLLDPRGSRPLPPHPAFQQILFGFPRSEFTASADADGEFTVDDLFYSPRTRRPYTPYGFSPVERCLPLVDLYMKRLHWFRTEFTDGVMPDLMMKSDMDFGNNPELLRGYEQVFNDALSGNIEARRRMRLLPNGFDPVIPKISDAKYSSDFDDFLIKSICGHFGVLPSQIGFTPKSGLGGAGHQEGEAANAETLGLLPILSWVIDILNQLSIKFLGMPQDLTFVFSNSRDEDMQKVALRRQTEMYSGQKTWNEIRTEMGLPLFTFPEADAPLLIQSGTITPLSASFEQYMIDASGQDNEKPDETVADLREQHGGDTEQVKAELGTFIKWAKTERSRPFDFQHVDGAVGDRLNALVKVDAVAARDYAAALRKAGGARPKAPSFREPLPRNHPARQMSDRLVNLYRHRFSSLGDVQPERLAAEWLKAPTSDPAGWMTARNITALNESKAVKVLTDLYLEAGWMGTVAGRLLTERARKTGKSVVWDTDWSNWTPGQPDTASLLLGPNGAGSGLQSLLDNAGITIKSIDQTRVDMLGTVLSQAVASGASVAQTADAIRALLNDPTRAEMIAHTEMTRATNAAQMDVYRFDGVTKVEWQTAGDDTVCDVCSFNEQMGPYPIDATPEPPEHPWCGCMLLPTEFGDDPAFDNYGEGAEDFFAGLGDSPQVEPLVASTGASFLSNISFLSEAEVAAGVGFSDIEEETPPKRKKKAMQADIVKVRRKAVDSALERLADIPDAQPGLIAVPWEIQPRPRIPIDDWAYSSLGLYVIEELFATQKYLKRDTLEWHLNHLGHVDAGHNTNPNIVIDGGYAKIYDGHHRLAALWLLNVACMNCWTLRKDAV